jgi:hypothetical protein
MLVSFMNCFIDCLLNEMGRLNVFLFDGLAR